MSRELWLLIKTFIITFLYSDILTTNKPFLDYPLPYRQSHLKSRSVVTGNPIYQSIYQSV
jgi:hypothetical protein